ncbi:MAG: hypothetical protein ACREVG_03195 [Burkholderiales bacterium]
MVPDTTKGLLILGGLVALFAWSVWAGLAGIALLTLWISWMVGREALDRRTAKKRCRAQLDQTLAEHGFALDAAFHSHHGITAIGVDATGRKFVYASPEGSELYDVEAIFEARARRLPQGDFEIGISVPGRVSKQPYWQGLIVAHRRDAARWVDTLKPHLGARLKVDGLS